MYNRDRFKAFREKTVKMMEEHAKTNNGGKIDIEKVKNMMGRQPFTIRTTTPSKTESNADARTSSFSNRMASMKREVEFERTRLETKHKAELERVMHENERLQIRVRELEKELAEK